MKKLYKSSRIKNHKITKKKKSFFDGVPLKSYVASRVIFRFGARNEKKKKKKKKSILGISSD